MTSALRHSLSRLGNTGPGDALHRWIQGYGREIGDFVGSYRSRSCQKSVFSSTLAVGRVLIVVRRQIKAHSSVTVPTISSPNASIVRPLSSNFANKRRLIRCDRIPIPPLQPWKLYRRSDHHLGRSSLSNLPSRSFRRNVSSIPPHSLQLCHLPDHARPRPTLGTEFRIVADHFAIPRRIFGISGFAKGCVADFGDR